MQRFTITFLAGLVLLAVTGCRELYQLLEETSPRIPQVKEFASGLATPLGLALDSQGRLWVTEVGTGTDDGKVSVITPDGRKYVAFEGFHSEINPQENLPVGLNHLLVQGHTLWILHEKGFLYKANISGFNPGVPPLQADDLDAEDIGAFVLDYEFEEDREESNPYNLTLGPGGDLYITDAAANAIIRRNAAGEFSVFATIPGIPNTTPVSPPVIDAVPTGIVYNGHTFLVTTLSGFPFIPGNARIFQVSLSGNVSVYQEGFTSLVDIALSPGHQPVVLEFARFSLGAGFAPNTGRLVRADGKNATALLENLNLPTAVASAGHGSYYINSFADGKISKVRYAY
jgi:hypothetical protein